MRRDINVWKMQSLTLINGENPESEKQVNCPPAVITRDNMDDVEMQDLLGIPTRLKK